MRYLVTGGAGFIGSHLTEALINRGDEVVVLDDLSTGRIQNIVGALESGRAEFVEGTTSDSEVVNQLTERCDRVFHLASAVGVRLIVGRAYESMLANVRGADIVLHAAADQGKRLLFASTSEIYGKNSVGAIAEQSDRLLGPPQRARWTYATAKVFGEQLAFALAERGAEMVVARLFNSTGPRQLGSYGMVLPTFVDQAMHGDDLTVYGDGSQSRCFAHAHDTVRGLVLLMDCDEASGKPFNVGSDIEISIRELAQLVIARTESSSGIALVPFESAYGNGFEELGRRQPDTSALRDLTGWEPKLTIDDAIDDLVTAYRSRR